MHVSLSGKNPAEVAFVCSGFWGFILGEIRKCGGITETWEFHVELSFAGNAELCLGVIPAGAEPGTEFPGRAMQGWPRCWDGLGALALPLSY